MSNPKTLDVIVPVSERCDTISTLHDEYSAAIAAAGWQPNFIYVLDGGQERARAELDAMIEGGASICIVQLGRYFGEATALSAGFAQSTTEQVLTLPAYYQVDPESLGELLGKVDEADMVLGRRWPRTDSNANQLMTRLFHRFVRLLTGARFQDLGCGVRLLKRRVIDEIPIYGDQHRFLPILAATRGFKVLEVDLAQSTKETYRRLPSFGMYPRRILDLVSVFFLVKFTKKPLRFFGLIGSATLAAGLLALAFVVVQRMFFGMALADRPALLIASLLAVLGVQLLAIGLVGEIVIFTHAKDMKEYTIGEIVGGDENPSREG